MMQQRNNIAEEAPRMPRRKAIPSFMDETIDERLFNMAAISFSESGVLRDIPPQHIKYNPFRRIPTLIHDELKAQIGCQGLQRPFWVRPHPEKARRYQLLYGSERLIASDHAGCSRVACVVVPADDTQLQEFGWLEGVQHGTLPLLEQAEGLRWLMDTGFYTIRSLAMVIGQHKGYVENRLALLRLPTVLQDLVQERPDALTAALLLAKVSDPDLLSALIAGVREGMLTVEALRAEAKVLSGKELEEEGRVEGSASTMPAEVVTWPLDSTNGEAQTTLAELDLLPGEMAIQRILMRCMALRKDGNMRLKVDTAVARIQEFLSEIGDSG
jgi:ParB/RepB/Spo0J family partition protein